MAKNCSICVGRSPGERRGEQMGYRHILLFLILLLGVLLIENGATANTGAAATGTSAAGEPARGEPASGVSATGTLVSEVGEILAPGSLIEIRDDLDFGLAREKRFCDGQEVGFLRSLMSDHCCTLRVNPLSLPELKQVVINKGLLRVTELDAGLPVESQAIKVAANLDIFVRCGGKLPTDEALKKAMGTLILIQEIKAAPRLVIAPSSPQLPPIQSKESAPSGDSKGDVSLNVSPEKEVHSEAPVVATAK